LHYPFRKTDVDSAGYALRRSGLCYIDRRGALRRLRSFDQIRIKGIGRHAQQLGIQATRASHARRGGDGPKIDAENPPPGQAPAHKVIRDRKGSATWDSERRRAKSQSQVREGFLDRPGSVTRSTTSLLLH